MNKISDDQSIVITNFLLIESFKQKNKLQIREREREEL